LNIFSGNEKTYQAWNGINATDLKTNRTFNVSGTAKPGEPYNNETDNYKQTHYQLFFNHQFNANWSFNVATFLTRGIGYYENYKANQKFSNYGLPNVFIGGATITRTDVVRQLWLDNYFMVKIIQLNSKKTNTYLQWVWAGLNMKENIMEDCLGLQLA
jgi:iron complex outermembrane receptor protein